MSKWKWKTRRSIQESEQYNNFMRHKTSLQHLNFDARWKRNEWYPYRIKLIDLFSETISLFSWHGIEGRRWQRFLFTKNSKIDDRGDFRRMSLFRFYETVISDVIYIYIFIWYLLKLGCLHKIKIVCRYFHFHFNFKLIIKNNN